MDRKVFVLEDGEYREIDFKEIKVGNLFKLEEPDGEVVRDEDGTYIYEAVEDAQANEDGEYFVEIK